VTLGTPALRPGETIEVSGLDGGGPALPGVGGLGLGAGGGGGERYRAVSIHHRLDGITGFTTTLELEGAGEDASLAGGLGALAAGLV
jgi:hypothetical protein